MKPIRWRWEFIERLAREQGATGLGVELGCKEGRTTSHLLKTLPSLRMIAVDTWGNGDGNAIEDYAAWDFDEIKHEFDLRTDPYRERLTVWQMDTVDAATLAVDGSLDFVFIDADHTTEGARADILAWWPKVRDGGLMIGHDTDWPSVMVAVHECFGDDVELWQNHDNAWYVVKRDDKEQILRGDSQ